MSSRDLIARWRAEGERLEQDAKRADEDAVRYWRLGKASAKFECADVLEQEFLHTLKDEPAL